MVKNSYFKKGFKICLLVLFVSSILVGIINYQNGLNSLITPLSQQLKDTNSDDLSLDSKAEASSWWNTSWRYRIQINITEPNIASRNNEPVSVWLNFTDLSPIKVSRCANDSIRVLEYSMDTWTLINSQVWNTTYINGNISTATITFSADVSIGETKTYYVYYNETGETINYATNLINVYSEALNNAYISNGVFEIMISNNTGVFNLSYDSGTVRNYHFNQSLSPLGPTYNYHYGTEYFYAYSTEWVEICAFEPGTKVSLLDSSGIEVANNTLNQYELWKYPYTGTLSAGLYQVISNNPVSIIVTSCTSQSGTSDDEVWAAYDTKILGRINKHLWITAFENDTYVTVTDTNSSIQVLNLHLNETDHIYNATVSAANINEVYLIESNHPVSVVAGVANDGMFTGIYGKNQMEFVFPAFRTWGVYAEEGPALVKWNSDKTGSGSRTLGEGEFYEVDSGNNNQGDIWVQLNSTKPVRIFTRDYGDTGTAVASLNPTGKLFYVCDPGGGTIRMTALEDGTTITYNQSSPSGTYRIINLDKGGTYTQTISGAGSKIISDKPIFVQYWDNGNPQSTSMYIPQETQYPRITDIELIENDSVFVKYRIDWEGLGGMNTTDYLTVYADYELFQLERNIWFNDAYTNPSFRIIDTYINGSQFDQYIHDDMSFLSLEDPNFSAENYTVVYDSTNDNNHMTLGIFLSNYYANGAVTLNSVDLSADYHDGIVHLISGNQTDMQTPNNPTSNDFACFTLWEYVQDGITDLNTIYETNEKIFNPLQISGTGNESSRFFNLIITLKDIDNLPAANLKVVVNKTDASILTKYTDYTNIGGTVTFSRLEDGEYSINVTYVDADFGKELNLNYTPQIFLNSANTTPEGNYILNIENLFITHFDITFVSSPALEPIDGANITFFETNGTHYTPIGSKISQNGFISLYWANTTGVNWNYTLNLTFYGTGRLIRLNKTPSDPWDSNYNFSLAQYTSSAIEVSLQDFSTELLNLTPKSQKVTYGENLTFGVRYNYTLLPTDNNTGISGASFDLQLSYEGNIVDTSSLVFIEEAPGPPGNYTLTFNSSELGLLAEKTYIFLVEASKAGFEPKTFVFTFEVDAIQTNISVTLNSSVHWGQNLTIIVKYTDNNTNDIPNATITYTWGTQTEELTMDDTIPTDIFYWVKINTSISFPGYQLIDISASKSNYETKGTTESFNLLERETKLNNSDDIFKEIIIYANDAHNFTFNYTDVLKAGKLIPDAVATYQWNGTIYDMDNLGNGYYVLDFDTETRAVGKYVIEVNIKRTNYSQPTMILFLNIQKRPVIITVMPPVLTLPQKTTTMILISLEDDATGNALSNLKLSYTIDAIPMGVLSSQGDGSYVLPIATESLSVGGHLILISMEHDNYTMPVAAVSLTITYEQIFGLDAPIFYTILIAAAVAIAAVSIYAAIKSARIPYIIKKIDETIKTIDKGKGEINVPVMKSKEQIFMEKFGADWESLGLETPIKPIKVKDVAMEEFKDLLSSMKGVKMTIKEMENLKSKLSKATKEEAMKLLESMGIPPDASERLFDLAKK